MDMVSRLRPSRHAVEVQQLMIRSRGTPDVAVRRSSPIRCGHNVRSQRDSGSLFDVL